MAATTQVRLAERYAHVGDPPDAPFSADGSGLAAPVLLDGDPPAAEVAALAERLGAPSTVAVSVADLLPERHWTGSAAGGLRTVVGRAGTEPVTAGLDDATPHWLVAGPAGAGRTSFLRGVVHGLAARYAPADLQLYLLDFTGRVGFGDLVPTAGEPGWLPHIRAVGVEPDREYGLAVLRDLHRELPRRAATVRRHGVARLADLPRDTPLPRIVAVVDGFDLLLAGDDALADEAVDLLAELVGANGSSGVHLVLAGPSPTAALPGRAEAVLRRLPLRVALPGGGGVLDPGDDRADTLPIGSAVLSTAAGTDTVLRFPDAHAAGGELARLHRELWQARPAGARPPSVFEGYATARVEDDATFAGLRPGGRRPLALVGRTVDVDGTSALFIMDTTPGRHLAVVSGAAAGAAVLRAATLSLARQHAPGDARFLLAPLVATADPAADDTAATLAAAGHPVDRLDAAGRRTHLAALAARSPASDHAAAEAVAEVTGRTYLVVFGADAASAALATADPETSRTGHDDLRALLRQGPGHGVHLLGWWRDLLRLADDLGAARQPDDIACLVALDVPGAELGPYLGVPDLAYSPRPDRALLVDRHDQRTRLIVPFTGDGHEPDGEG
ncbi:FtsK/SpoIIIE domain-containing protein [Micromonospora sp. LZ34]